MIWRKLRKVIGTFSGSHGNFAGSSNGRTRVFGTRYRGSNPCPAAITLCGQEVKATDCKFVIPGSNPGTASKGFQMKPLLLSLILKRKVKWSFCSGCLVKRWKIKRWFGNEEYGWRILCQCPFCKTHSYT